MEIKNLIHKLSHDYTCKLIKMLFQRNKTAPSRRDFTSLIGTFKEVVLSVGGTGGRESFDSGVYCRIQGPITC